MTSYVRTNQAVKEVTIEILRWLSLISLEKRENQKRDNPELTGPLLCE